MTRIMAIILALSLLTGGAAALAEGLPEDEPIEYPGIALDEEAEEFVLEMAQDEPEPVTVKPELGEASKGQVITVSLAMDIDFEYPYSQGLGKFSNPATSVVNVQYVLQISVAELMRTLGKTGYTDEAYAQLSAQPNFDPENSWINIAQTKGIAPGKTVKYISLGTLPDGSALSKGEYTVYAVMSAFDVKTNKRSVVGVRSQVKMRILNDVFALTFKDGIARISVFNPVDARDAARYSLVITQAELLAKTGKTHAEGEYKPGAVVTVAEIGELLPGENIEDEPVALMNLPDGEALNPGEYYAYIGISTQDLLTGVWTLTAFGTQVVLTVS